MHPCGSSLPYPAHRSTFQTLRSRHAPAALPLHIEHVLTSPGYNTSPLARHLLGLHLGAPVTIAHWRDQVAGVHCFQSGDVVFMPAGAPVHYAHADPVDALYIALDPLFVRQVAAQMAAPAEHMDFTEEFGTADPALAAIGRALLDELYAPGVGSTLYVEALMIQLVIQLVRRYATGLEVRTADTEGATAGLHARLRPAIDYIEQHFRDDVSLADLAAVVHLTPSYFNRLFKRAYHVSPYRYVIQRRIAAASELVHSSRLTLAEIATRVGFADASHLIRHYRRLTGITPRA